MRLTPTQVEIIKTQAKIVFGDKVNVYLFGSRVDDARKGGDIDLLIEPNDSSKSNRNNINLFYVNLILHLGEQKIDILLKNSGHDKSIYTTALETGILL